jgi:hypothetical protein
MPIRAIPDLYKYVSLDGLFRLLRNRSIRFTQPDRLNDPYECHLTLDREALVGDYRKFRASSQPGITADELDAAVEAVEEQLVIDALLHYRQRRNSMGVVSLTEDPRNLLMWAHYADEHRGAVVELDIWQPQLRPGSCGADKLSGLEKVVYSRNKVTGLPWPDTIVEVLSTKSLDWAYEKEWRLIRTLNLTREAAADVFVVDFDVSAIKSIRLGAGLTPASLRN